MPLLQRMGAGREARKAFKAFTKLRLGPGPKARQCFNQGGSWAREDVEVDSVYSKRDEKETLAVQAVHEQQARDEAKMNNATYYDRNLQTDDDIRLLRIDPGEGPISGSLEYSSLIDHPPYDSLSYCWGEQKHLQPVIIDGRDGFLVSGHLHAALVRLRRPNHPRLVWIDVICVNQANIPERNRSVELMWRIYAEARRVIVWIGEIDPKRPTCKRLYPGTDEDNAQLTLCAKPGLAALEHGHLTASLSEVLQDMEFESVRRSSGEVWWKRLWVIQEFSCAREEPTVYVGPHAISWKFFSTLMHTDVHDRLTLFHHLRTHEDQSLLDLLDMAKIFHCSDPRDRIYALLGLAKEAQIPIIPDYSKPVAQVYEEAALLLIREEQTVDVLLDESPMRENTGFASWVPDFKSLRRTRDIKSEDGYAAGEGIPDADLVDQISQMTSDSSARISAPRSLRLKALYFDTIVNRTTEATLPAPDFTRRPIMAKHFHKPAMSRPLQTFTHILEELKIDFTAPTNPSLDRLPSVGYLMLDYLFGGTRSVVAEFERVRRLRPSLESRDQELDTSGLAQKFGLELTDAIEADIMVSALWESAFLWTRHTRSYTPGESTRNLLGGQEMYHVSANTYKKDFFSTANGFIGLAPATLQVGDEVIVPFGASRPFIVRKQGEHYSLVGDAVMPGIMSGQMMNLFREGSIQARDFFLQ